MCGICGYMQKEKIIDTKVIENMKNAILNRGKNENNTIVIDNVALGHARLSIIDLKNGKQPLQRTINNKTYTITYNGELYNTQLLRNILISKGYTLTTQSDTEVLLLLYIEFKEQMLKYINGIFAFAIYDEENKFIFLAKDRLGIKPLFYAKTENALYFSSEIKGILATGKVDKIMTRRELLELFALGPAHTPGKTYFKDIYELEAGHYAYYKNNELTITKYWDLIEKKCLDKDEEVIENVRYLVTDSTKRQLVSDVGVASMLSGGLDSSILTTLASDNILKLNTYSIDYKDNDKDFTPNSYQQTKDSDFITIMTKYLNTKHKNIIVTDEDLYNNLLECVICRDMPGMADIDSSMYVFCREIEKNGEKVILSGECSDEIFAGYPWFYNKHLKETSGFPWALSENLRESLLRKDLIQKGDISSYVQNAKLSTLKNTKHISQNRYENEFKDINYLTIKYFMNTLVERTDRTSMRHSLEVRVPYADHRIFEYVYNVDTRLKLGITNTKNNENNKVIEKYILKEAFKNYIPSQIIDRKKSPFPKTYSKKYLALLEKKMTEILDDNNSRILEIIDKDFVMELINAHGKGLKENLFGQLMTYPQTIAYLIQIEYWLKLYDIKIEL